MFKLLKIDSTMKEVMTLTQKDIGPGDFVVVSNDPNYICLRLDGGGQQWLTLDEAISLNCMLDKAIISSLQRKLASKDYS